MEETAYQEAVEGGANKRKLDCVKKDVSEAREWLQEMRKVLFHRDSCCITLCCMTKEEFKEQWELGVSIVVGSDAIFCCGYNGIMKEYATIEDAAKHISEKSPDARMFCFYGNYYDQFIGYPSKSLEGPWWPEDVIPVIHEAQKMLSELENVYDQLDQLEEGKGTPEDGKDDSKAKDGMLWKEEEELTRPRSAIPNVDISLPAVALLKEPRIVCIKKQTRLRDGELDTLFNYHPQIE